MTGVLANLTSGGRPRARRLLPPGTFVGFALAVLAVILVATFSFRSLRSRSVDAERVTRTLKVIGSLDMLLASVQDAETGQRGFLLTGSERYLDPYVSATAALDADFKSLRSLISDNPQQQRRLNNLQQLTTEKLEELAQTVALTRAGNTEDALALVRTDRGRALMEQIRSVLDGTENEERTLLASREGAWQQSERFSVFFTIGSSILLLMLIAAAAAMTSRDYRGRETESWLRAGLAGLSARIQGDQRMDRLGASVIEYLASYLDAQIGAIYIREGDDGFRRFGSYAMAQGLRPEVLRAGDGLLGQAAKENRLLYVEDVPKNYFSVTSALGSSRPCSLLVAPASSDGIVQAVVELGFFHTVRPADRELLARVSQSLGVAVRTSKDRTRLEELLEETQVQAEELQAQQEELRVSNEELEEQGRVLTASQVQLEAQQAELEQTNAQLEEQTKLLERQKDALSSAQVVLTEKAAELERATQYKNEFLANMSHELRTPLNSTLILAKLLADNKEGNLSDEQLKYAQTISSAGNDLLALINDILDLSKIEAGKVDVNSESILIAAAVDALVKTVEPLAQQKGLTFRATVDPGTPERIDTDPQRLAQIMKNLLSNALKFTDKGEVSLRVFPIAENSIAFAVHDAGIGIPQHQQSIIFEAFRQADGSTHRRYGGTGLGLSISRDLARLLGGNIDVRSTVGQGSIFTLILPLVFAGPIQTPQTKSVSLSPSPIAAGPVDQQAGPATPSPVSREVSSPISIEDDRDQLKMGTRLILVIEDDARFAAILRDLAHEMGFQCVVSHSANDGLVAVAAYTPSAILLDMNLPDHSGLGVLDQLKHNPKTRHIPVHIVSVADYSHEALGRGAIGYALKPVKREQLIEAFQRLEAKFSQNVHRVLVIEDDERQRDSIRALLANDTVQITDVGGAGDALDQLRSTTFDCVVMDLNLPDFSGYELLKQMAEHESVSHPPVIIYTGRSLTRDEEQKLGQFSKSIIIKDARSPERLLDEVTLFLHQVESTLPMKAQKMLKVARNRDATLEGRRILVVEDDVRNVFAVSAALEAKGVKVEVARNGREALEVLKRGVTSPRASVNLVLMDIMMPEMDGFTAIREIRNSVEWRKLPIIAMTAKATRDDQEQCLAAGANDYIAKPLDVERLLSLVRVWMPK